MYIVKNLNSLVPTYKINSKIWFQIAVVKATYMACERMRKDKGGKGGYIINIASLAGSLLIYHLFYHDILK